MSSYQGDPNPILDGGYRTASKYRTVTKVAERISREEFSKDKNYHRRVKFFSFAYAVLIIVVTPMVLDAVLLERKIKYSKCL